VNVCNDTRVEATVCLEATALPTEACAREIYEICDTLQK